MHFTVWIVQPLYDPHARCLVEAATGVAFSLRRLGHEVQFNPGRGAYVENPTAPFGRLVVFNANKLPATPLPADAIIFNAEQVQTDGEWGAVWQSSNYVKLLRRHLIWDYSATNAKALSELGCDKIVQCKIGYYPELTDVIPAKQQDVDVLFIGSTNDRRVKVLTEMAKSGLKVKVLTACYGEERNAWIARAKVVLNCHFYPQPVFEIFRVSHLVANGKAVVSEDGGRDEGLEKLAKDLTAYVPYDGLVQACWRLVNDEAMRKQQETRGQEAFQKLKQTDYVKAALVESGIE
jgi:hypothetical protein